MKHPSQTQIPLIEDRGFLLGLMFLGLAGLTVWIASGYRLGSTRTMGPGYFPVAMGLLLGLLALLMILRSIFGLREPVGRFSVRPAVLILAGALLFAFLLRPAGLIVAIVAMVGLGSLASPRLGWAARIGLAIGLALGCAEVFVGLLGQSVPLTGPWLSF